MTARVPLIHSIRFKITVITLGAILTAILCVFFASLSTIQAKNDQESVETMYLIAQNTRKMLEKDTEDIEQAVEMAASIAIDTLDSTALAEGGVIGSAAGQSKRTPEQVAKLDAYLGGYCDGLQNACATIASRTNGIVTYYYCISPDISLTQHGFFYSRVGKTGFGEREPLDARELDPNDLEHTTWYYTPIERGRPSWVGPYTAHFLDEMLISSYLVPIYKAGTFIGVLGMDIPVDSLTSQVSSVKVYDSGFACLMDADGRILYHPDLEYGIVPDLPLDAKVLQNEDSGDDLIRYTSNGQTRQISFTTLSNGMKLAIVAPTDEVNASLTRLTKNVVAIGIVIVAIFVIVILLLLRVITRPLERLTTASQQLAAGDYNVELDYESRDEVGVLTKSFQEMRDQLKGDIEDLNRKATTDDLTGLPNQRHFFELAEAERDRLLDLGKHPVMLYFNLIGMKHFNRQYGFDEGDRLICAVADILSGQFGERCVGRFGQDHFAAVSDEEHVEAGLRELFRACQDANNGRSLPVSAGIYRHSLEEVDVGPACDRAKYACDQRRGSYVSGFRYFDMDMLKQVEALRYIISHLDQALEEEWIQVHYQPIVRAASGKVCDEEALSRWFDPERGLLAPDDFVPALENAGLIYQVDLYVLDRVLEKIRMQEELGLAVVPHSINLSRSDFDACDIVEEIRKRVDAAGVDRDKITVEITESVIGVDFGFMKEQIERFQRLGFPVWMDDFGSGYSSLDVLRDIEFDLIKFDRSFMQKFDEGGNGRIILTEMMKMAIELGVDTLCEGVETEEQSRFLQEIGCSKLQGFYFCRPLAFSEIVRRYEKGIQIGFESRDDG